MCIFHVILWVAMNTEYLQIDSNGVSLELLISVVVPKWLLHVFLVGLEESRIRRLYRQRSKSIEESRDSVYEHASQDEAD